MKWWSGKRRVVLAGIALLTVALIGGGTFALTHQAVRASGSIGGSCQPENGPSCTFKGNSATVSYESWDSTGCLYTNVGVTASETFSHTPPGGVAKSGPGASVVLFQYNFCTDDPSQMVEAWGFADDVIFKTTGSLETASASGTAMLTDYGTNYGAQLPASFDLTWKGTGPFTKTIDSSHMRTLDFTMHTHLNADSRIGIATGSLVIDGTNYATEPSSYGSLLRSQGSDIQITKN